MKRTNLGILWVAAFATTLVFACGSDEKPSTGSTTDDDSSDSSSETPSSGSSAPNNPKPPADGIGAPVLTDVDPDTELSDLDDDQLKEVCTAYVKTSDAVSDSLGQLCPAQSLFFAIQTESVIDDESYQAECAAQLDACEEQVEEANEETPEQRCAGAGACGATLEDFNACNAQQGRRPWRDVFRQLGQCHGSNRRQSHSSGWPLSAYRGDLPGVRLGAGRVRRVGGVPLIGGSGRRPLRRPAS
jgi:hypothetical protein